MKLTGKAKEDFDDWLYENYDKCQIRPQEEVYWHHFSNELTLYDIYEKLPLSLKQQLIIEWFDSVGIYINIEYYHKRWYLYLIPKTGIGNYLIDMNEFYSRQEATKQAIIKANEIYNEKEA